MAKARDKSKPSAPSKKKGKKRGVNGPAVAAMKSSKASKPNPFETIWSRSKFSIIGRRGKGEERRVGRARSQAIEKRNKSLLKEYEESGKSSKFIDRRIGEKDDTLQDFDKAILRMQRQRQLKLKRSSKFNLPDEEEDDDDDSAFNQSHSLSAKDDFEDNVSLDDEDEAEEYIRLSNVADSSKHFPSHDMNDSLETSSQDGNENTHKTKKQVMMEIIQKSKFFKEQKAKDKEEDRHLMEKLDEDFRSLAQSEALRSLTQPTKMNALKALLNKNPTGKTSKEEKTTVDKELFKKEQPDAYDKLVKEMLHDIRARPSDRTKTPEEIALEEKERLELLEEERKNRMLAADDSDEGSEGSDNDELPDIKKRKTLSGDDLGDSFSVGAETANKKGWVDDIYEREDAAGDKDKDVTSEGSDSEEDDQGADSDEDDSSGNESDAIPSVKDWEQSDDDALGTNDEAELEEKELNDNDAKGMKVRKMNSDNQKADVARRLLSKQETLPYVIEVPKNLVELCSLLDNRSDAEVVEAINRIRACNSIKLTAENRWKMQGFYGVLLQYFATLASRKPLNIGRINSLVRPLMEMSGETPFYAAICARERLSHIRTRFCTDIKLQDKSSWPSLKTLLLLRLWSLVFPCSDFRHAVMTPAALLMCEYLMRCSIVSGQDIVVGSFLCSMMLNVCKQSHKFCPEALNFLQVLLISAIDLKPGRKNLSQMYHTIELKTTKPWLRICSQESEVHALDFFEVMNMEAESTYFSSDDFRASVLAFMAEILKGFISIYEGLSSFTEIFSPISGLLLAVLQNDNIPQLLRNNLEDIVEFIKKKTDEHQKLRQPLQMRKQKPEPIKLLNPKFEEDFVKGRDYDPDRERAEMKKMKKRLKSEKKGAMRELRKDNHYLFQVKQKDRMREEEERTEKYGKAMAFLQEQEHAFKSGQLGKGRKRRR
ncbi:nucleolar protein 14 [Dioscorea cayenensis subsp. rotundata]|uniref:Nucleolar protein 14 n=1 Tax=Dioscorea cayennensis subsp. rotundata TaxID=55577 RepID=A0AB40CK47_DIOCR|nr:nucleolar protein 14 [Dioscorea cayenensis subsp. rotundata]